MTIQQVWYFRQKHQPENTILVILKNIVIAVI